MGVFTGIDIIEQSPVFFWAVAIAAVFAVAVSKSGFGGAFGALSMPILLFVLPPKLAIGVLLPIFLLTDVWVVYLTRKFLDKRLLLIMCSFAVAGQFVGWLLFDFFSDGMLTLIIGIVAVVTALSYGRKVFFPGRTTIGENAAKVAKRVWVRAPMWCGLSGISSFVSLSGGIPAQVFLLPHALARQAFVGTMSLYFFVINLGKVPFYMELNLFTPTTISLSLWLVPVIPLGVYGGLWLNRNLSDKLFYHISHVVLFFMGAKLTIDGLS
ncbi:sulfite exporter TauE/SafE family protein [Alphaproteobacteria bacterium]|nr:sulfite exporter TauE/SafE family protein [Alphaproteobacteria bacterium]